jgi:hypothetical protein
MGILDDAIKEHLELKRQHGAAEDELKQLEDEAFGAAERPGGEGPSPDPVAEAPTEFMAQPEIALAEEAEPEAAAESALAEPDESAGRPSPRSEIADLQEAPPSAPVEGSAEPDEPAEEESPAMEHDAISPSGPTTEEREAIAEQPTEMYDVEEELGRDSDEAGEEEEEAEEEYEEDDDFWDEKRLSDELDQALEAPSEAEDELPVIDEELEDEGEHEVEEAGADDRTTASDDEEDVLEETPDFLEETPEDDQLWFEQKPPKDFDFDD